jgi:two-component system LytT family response regulator
MYTAIIVEDELHSREFLRNIVLEYCPDIQLKAAESNVQDGIAAIEKHHPDIVFLDIEMQSGTGFDLLQHFAKPAFDVIFTTAYDHYAIKAIRFSAVDYLLKPIDIELLQQAVQRVIEKRKSQPNPEALQMLLRNLKAPKTGDQSISLSTSDGLEFIPLKEIIRIESTGPYSQFFLKDRRKITVSRTLKEYEMLLSDHGFVRVHNSHMVNISEVKRMVRSDGGYAVMSDDSEITISPKKKEEFLQAMAARMV